MKNALLVIALLAGCSSAAVPPPDRKPPGKHIEATGTDGTSGGTGHQDSGSSGADSETG